MDEKFIAGYEFWREKMQDDFEEELVRLRQQIILLKEHQSVMETCIRHIGQDLVEIRKRLDDVEDGI